jgi:hypothetical protein
MYVVLDTETKCVDSENEKLLSVQVGNATNQKLFWADSKEAEWDMESAKKEIVSFMLQGVTFVGYNIDFDVKMVKGFLDIEIPKAQTLDLCHVTEIEAFHKVTKDWSLECACKKYNVNVDQKGRMKEKSQEYKNRLAVQEKAKVKAMELAKKKGWTTQWTYDTFKNQMLDNAAIGPAIYDAYLEFVKSGGRKDTLFYYYAVGDIIAEYNLLKKLGY